MKKTAKKLLLYIGGLFILAAGVNISKEAQLGVSAVTAIPYAIELIWNIEFGKAALIFYSLLIVLQIILLRREYKPIQILQILGAFLFGIFARYSSRDYLLFWLPIPYFYITKLFYLFVSIIVIGIGISLYLIPNYLSLPTEGILNAIAEFSKDKLKFSKVKVASDIGMVVISALLSIIFLGGIRTVREGTIIAALFIGNVIGAIYKRYKLSILEWIER